MFQADPLKKLIIRFAQLHRDDQRWLLSQLSPQQQQQLHLLFDELNQLGILPYLEQLDLSNLAQATATVNPTRQMPVHIKEDVVLASLYLADLSTLNEFELSDDLKSQIKLFHQNHRIPPKLRTALLNFVPVEMPSRTS